MEYPSVTTVLSPYTDFSMIRPEVLEHASARGTLVHSFCTGFALGLWAPSPPAECAGYVDSFKRWFELVDVVYFAEIELIDPGHGYYGHPDLSVRMKGEDYIRVPDLKTPIIKQLSWRVQIAAYNNLARIKLGTMGIDLPIRNSGSIRLSPDGKTPKYDVYEETLNDFNIFLSALNCWRFFKGGS